LFYLSHVLFLKAGLKHVFPKMVPPDDKFFITHTREILIGTEALIGETRACKGAIQSVLEGYVLDFVRFWDFFDEVGEVEV
jgi:hypothetical protein